MADGFGYLVDVTNCDDDTIGAPDKLFMVGYKANPEQGVYYYLSDNLANGIRYTFDNIQINLFSDEELAISDADFTPESEYPDFTVVDGVITAYTGSETELVIPAEIDGATITGIGDGVFEGRQALIAVTLPDTLLSIGDSAFAATGLTSVTLPGGITSIGDGAFQNTQLTSVSVAENADTFACFFYEPDTNGNPRLYQVHLPSGLQGAVGYGIFLHAPLRSLQPDFVTPRDLTRIGQSAMSGVAATYVWLNDGLTTIEDGAFHSCEALRFVRIPGSCTFIGNGVFPENTTLNTTLLIDGSDWRGSIPDGCDVLYYFDGFDG